MSSHGKSFFITYGKTLLMEPLPRGIESKSIIFVVMNELYNIHCHLSGSEFSPLSLSGDIVVEWATATKRILLSMLYGDVPSQDLYEVRNIAIDPSRETLPHFVEPASTNAPQRACFSIGLHPWHLCEERLTEALARVESLAVEPWVVAIGEVGLDKCCPTPMDLQIKALRAQMLIASSVGKPLVLHLVRATDELLSLCKELHFPHAMLLHGFRGKPQHAEQLLRKGLYLSFGEHYHSESLCEAFRSGQMLLETDTLSTPIIDLYRRVTEELRERISPEELMKIAQSV